MGKKLEAALAANNERNRKDIAEQKARAEKIKADYDRKQREIKMQLEIQAEEVQWSKEAAEAAKMQMEEAKKQTEEVTETMKKMTKMQAEEAKKQKMKAVGMKGKFIGGWPSVADEALSELPQ